MDAALRMARRRDLCSADLVLYFGAAARIDDALHDLADRFPDSLLFGCSTAAGILDTELDETGVAAVAYGEADLDRRRTEQTTKLMASELEEANDALIQSMADIREQNLRFSIAFDNMANGLSLFDHNGRLAVCNRRERELLGIEETQALAGCRFEAFLRTSPVL